MNKNLDEVNPVDMYGRLLEALGDMVTTFHDAGCHICHGDCASANPPVIGCPSDVLRNAREIIAKATGERP